MDDNDKAARLFLAGLAMQAIILKGTARSTADVARAARLYADRLIVELDENEPDGKPHYEP